MPVIRERFRVLSKQSLMDALEHSGLPFAAIARPEDLFEDPQLNAGGLVEVTLADGRKARLPATPVIFGDARPPLRRDLPQAGEHLAEVLAECGYDAAAIAALQEQGAPAAG
jgi:crotonobetainyl-CoA:carnitine CoA-transferase CaiB-like acyl-CoA transferase